MLEIQDLVGQLGDVIGAFSARVWTHTTALQHARGLVATPYILCGVTIGAHLSACCPPRFVAVCEQKPAATGRIAVEPHVLCRQRRPTLVCYNSG